MPDDETAAAKMGATVVSTEENYLAAANSEEHKKILAIISTLTEVQRRRVYKRFKENLSFEDIGRGEGVSASAIKRSCEIAFKKLMPYSDFLQNVALAKWVDLL